MALYSATAILSSVRGLIQGTLGYVSPRPRTPDAFIHILEDDSLLNIFLFCRPPVLDDEGEAIEILGGRKWDDERWWYSLAQVCRRWRYLALESASFLRLSLLCTYGTPVADILAHSPPVPLILDYCDPYDYIMAEDELDIISALGLRDRVRRIRFMQPIQMLQRLVKALHGEFPNLEYLFIERHTFYIPSPNGEDDVTMDIPATFRAPRLRYLVAMGLSLSIASSLFTTNLKGNLVTLTLNFDTDLSYFHPNPLLRLVSQLGASGNTIDASFPDYNMESQLLRKAVMRRVTLYFHRVGLQTSNVYLRTVLPWTTIQTLEILQFYLLDRLKTYLILPRRRLMSFAGTVCLWAVRLTFFKDYLCVDAYSRGLDFRTYRFCMRQGGRHLDRQLASVTKFFHALTAVFSPVESLILRYNSDRLSLTPPESEWNNEADPTQWYELFRAFSNLKFLHMDQAFVGQLSRALQPEELEGGSSTVDLLLPELRELWYSIIDHSQFDDRDPTFFAEFASARRNAGRPIGVFEAVLL